MIIMIIIIQEARICIRAKLHISQLVYSKMYTRENMHVQDEIQEYQGGIYSYIFLSCLLYTPFAETDDYKVGSLELQILLSRKKRAYGEFQVKETRFKAQPKLLGPGEIR